jgi:hypothetical protein
MKAATASAAGRSPKSRSSNLRISAKGRPPLSRRSSATKVRSSSRKTSWFDRFAGPTVRKDVLFAARVTSEDKPLEGDGFFDDCENRFHLEDQLVDQ